MEPAPVVELGQLGLPGVLIVKVPVIVSVGNALMEELVIFVLFSERVRLA
jgi:hypothetical protein